MVASFEELRGNRQEAKKEPDILKILEPVLLGHKYIEDVFEPNISIRLRQRIEKLNNPKGSRESLLLAVLISSKLNIEIGYVYKNLNRILFICYGINVSVSEAINKLITLNNEKKAAFI